MKKDLIQRGIINKILHAEFRGIVLSSVRSGKTRILLKAIKEDWDVEIRMPSVLVCYPNIDIRNSWEKECDLIMYHPDIAYCTYASLHKMIDTIWDYIIFDEAHLIPEEHKLPIAGQIAKSNKKVIFASGTYNDITLADLQIATSLPLIVNYTTEDAIKDGLISDYTVYIHQYDLDPIQKREFGSSRKWWSTDVKELARLTNRVENSYGENKMLAALSRMRFINTNTSLYHAVNKWILANLDKRFILFTENEEFGKKFHLPMFNSKSKDDVVMQEFINQKINRLCLIKKGSSGVTYPNLRIILVTAIDSNGENLLQKIGRSLLTDTDSAEIHIFVSNKSFQLKWLESSLEGVDKNKVFYV